MTKTSCRIGKLLVLAILASVIATPGAQAGAFTGWCSIVGDGEAAPGTVPHQSCCWGGTCMQHVKIVLAGAGPDWGDDSSPTGTLNVDIYDSRTGKLIENRNIEIPKECNGGPQAPPDPGTVLCGHHGAEPSEDCGDGSDGNGSGIADESCGCNPDEGDEGCCFQEVGHSVDLRTGFYSRSDRDLEILGPGANIEFDRFYNSNRGETEFVLDTNVFRYRWRQRHPSMLGYGWRHRYQESIRVVMPMWLDGYEDSGDWGQMVQYFRSDGVGVTCKYVGEQYGFVDGEYRCRGTLDRMIRKRDEREFVVIKPSGERHVFELPGRYDDSVQPIEIPLKRVEAYETANEKGGINLFYCGEEDCGQGSNCPPTFGESGETEVYPLYLCKIVLDESNGSRGVELRYQAGKLEKISSLEDDYCLVFYEYTPEGNLKQVTYQEEDEQECRADGSLRYWHNVKTEGELPPDEAFTCRELDGDCEWMCGRNEEGYCLPLWGKDGEGICGFPEADGQCKYESCVKIDELAICVPEDPDSGIECDEPTYGSCQDGCLLVQGEKCVPEVSGNGVVCGPPIDGLCESGCVLQSPRWVCVPSAVLEEGEECTFPAEPLTIESFWGSENTVCAFDVTQRIQYHTWLNRVVDEDGMWLEEIAYRDDERWYGRASWVITPTERQEFYYNYTAGTDQIVVQGLALGSAPVFTYEVEFADDHQTITGNCGCGPVKEIKWETVGGRYVVKWMKSGKTQDGQDAYTVYSYDELGRVTRAVIGTSSHSDDQG